MVHPLRTLRRARVAAALLVLLGVAAGALPPGRAAVRDGTVGKIAGVVVSSDANALQQPLAADDFPRIRSTGLNSVVVYSNWYVDGPRATTVRRTGATVSDAALEEMIREAKANGLHPVLHPAVHCTRQCSWRGSLQPADVDAFFASYRAMLNHYAALAQRTGVSLLFIGSEMRSLQGHAHQWRRVAGEVRARYRNAITYGANWDDYDTVGFWDAVDLVSVSGYFPLSESVLPRVAELKRAWYRSGSVRYPGRNWVAALADLHRRTRKPILFGEAGYRSTTQTAKDPYEPTRPGAPDPQGQADAYQALLETFEAQPWWAGALWWQWFPVDGGVASTGFGIKGKTVEALLTRWYANGWRPGDRDDGAVPLMPLPVGPNAGPRL